MARTFDEVHDDLLQSYSHMHMRVVAECLVEMQQIAVAGKIPDDMHADECPACEAARQAIARVPEELKR